MKKESLFALMFEVAFISIIIDIQKRNGVGQPEAVYQATLLLLMTNPKAERGTTKHKFFNKKFIRAGVDHLKKPSAIDYAPHFPGVEKAAVLRSRASLLSLLEKLLPELENLSPVAPRVDGIIDFGERYGGIGPAFYAPIHTLLGEIVNTSVASASSIASSFRPLMEKGLRSVFSQMVMLLSNQQLYETLLVKLDTPSNAVSPTSRHLVADQPLLVDYILGLGNGAFWLNEILKKEGFPLYLKQRFKYREIMDILETLCYFYRPDSECLVWAGGIIEHHTRARAAWGNDSLLIAEIWGSIRDNQLEKFEFLLQKGVLPVLSKAMLKRYYARCFLMVGKGEISTRVSNPLRPSEPLREIKFTYPESQEHPKEYYLFFFFSQVIDREALKSTVQGEMLYRLSTIKGVYDIFVPFEIPGFDLSFSIFEQIVSLRNDVPVSFVMKLFDTDEKEAVTEVIEFLWSLKTMREISWPVFDNPEVAYYLAEQLLDKMYYGYIENFVDCVTGESSPESKECFPFCPASEMVDQPSINIISEDASAVFTPSELSAVEKDYDERTSLTDDIKYIREEARGYAEENDVAFPGGHDNFADRSVESLRNTAKNLRNNYKRFLMRVRPIQAIQENKQRPKDPDNPPFFPGEKLTARVGEKTLCIPTECLKPIGRRENTFLLLPFENEELCDQYLQDIGVKDSNVRDKFLELMRLDTVLTAKKTGNAIKFISVYSHAFFHDRTHIQAELKIFGHQDRILLESISIGSYQVLIMRFYLRHGLHNGHTLRKTTPAQLPDYFYQTGSLETINTSCARG